MYIINMMHTIILIKSMPPFTDFPRIYLCIIKYIPKTIHKYIDGFIRKALANCPVNTKRKALVIPHPGHEKPVIQTDGQKAPIILCNATYKIKTAGAIIQYSFMSEITLPIICFRLFTTLCFLSKNQLFRFTHLKPPLL